MTSSVPQGSTPELSALTPVQEYSWEWGAFPQPSPVNQTFGKTGRADTVLGGRPWGRGRGKEKANSELGVLLGDDLELDNKEVGAEWGHGRSRSVPPELDGSPTRDRRGQPLPEGGEGHFEAGGHKELPAAAGDLEMERDRIKEELVAFSQGGKLGPSKADFTRFILQIGEKKVAFELSVAFSGEEHGNATGTHRMDVFDGHDEVEAARIFSQGKVDFEKFLHSEDVVHSPNLVIRWADNRYLPHHTLSKFDVDIYCILVTSRVPMGRLSWTHSSHGARRLFEKGLTGFHSGRPRLYRRMRSLTMYRQLLRERWERGIPPRRKRLNRQ